MARSLSLPSVPIETTCCLGPEHQIGSHKHGSVSDQVAAWNQTLEPVPCDAYVPALIASQAAIRPHSPALVTHDATLTYAELDAQANQLAHRLKLHGVGPDVLVGLCVDRSAAMVVGALGILKAGGAYVPLDPAYPAQRLTFMLHDAHAPILVTQQRFVAQLSAGPWHVVVLDGPSKDLWSESVVPSATLSRGDHLAYVIYTSGSTGCPKGVEITHENLLNLVHWHQRAFSVTPSDRASQLAGPGFDAAVWELWPYLTAGASIYLPDENTRLAPDRLRDWLLVNEITLTFVPTVLAERLMSLPWPTETALRVMLTGAEALHQYPSPSLPFVLVNNYGPTETTVVATSGVIPPNECPESTPTIGRPIANTQIYIVDEDMQILPVGVPGELHIGGAGLAKGYLNRPDLTAERFIANPFSTLPGSRLYKTGDLACYRSDGSIEYVGRLDDQIKIRGYRIEPEEIVAVLNTHSGVQSSVVIARESAGNDKQLVAYVVPESGSVLSETDLRTFLQDRLPEYMVPATFIRLDSLPLTPNGKMDRAALPAPDRADIIRDEAFAAPRNPLEERLAAIAAELLGVKQVGMDDNFFFLGGHSLLGAQLIARVYRDFGVEISLSTLFQAPTLSSLAMAVEERFIAELDAMSDDMVERMLG